MTPDYFRALAASCRKSARDCFDLFAKEEFRRLENEFSAKADELESAPTHAVQFGSRNAGARTQFIDR